MERKTENEWRGNDLSLSECLDEYGMVYSYNGKEFDIWCGYEFDDDGIANKFINIWMDNSTIDDYFEKDGEHISSICGVTPYEMDYEWKMDALLSYYGCVEFIGYGNKVLSKDEVYTMVRDKWSGVID